MLDSNMILAWSEVEHDLYEEDGHVFGIELDLFNDHTYFYHRVGRVYDYLSDDIYEAINEFNNILRNPEDYYEY